MQIKVPCKINLGLHILNRRPDGFHNIESILYPVQLCDVLTIEKSERFIFTSSGIQIDGSWDDNLCVKAYRLMQQHYDLSPVAIHLQKNIPAGAGLGGGSADAAYTLKAINQLFNLGASNQELKALAATLGSDCPFFIDSVPALATGRGEVLAPVDINLNGYWLLIAKPGTGVSTAEAYRGACPLEGRSSLVGIVQQPISKWQGQLCNDFENHIFKTCSAIGRIKEQLISMGALFAAMSGSGSAVYGIFSSQPLSLKGDDISFQAVFLIKKTGNSSSGDPCFDC
ncbi:MAG: 4-(cytidine 5'-diphospho)-2-C-methyl-D-erythritol kinase [Bacteroidetes bacterium GWE2_42_24]|nr:MAG: 4-(cytidine 5'-diphospho)-2-C-methyl-D-erythritol kinase [Bacteroidetes bacterium GWE2_42_24]OFY30618.1 MAG: 4-(cytidine 5'-diphospho)-2-C-methyl-D-erythritol kinase [Bacteroidetes bacterium GWF2_43_11]PKP23466.1 MAG: 4-(cytidine 5'-diphospho)-2-C-methyl-D-erythritol kinase [Bacteroidetes bacterium HGW-Bacteroidetes-22]